MQRKIKQLFIHHRQQCLVLAGLSVGVLVLTTILYYSDNFIFERFLGAINPLFAFSLIILAGAAAVSFLVYNGWFNIYKGNLMATLRTSCLALLFIPISIFVDVRIGFPSDMNILVPEAWLFYPAIGFLVEILFHVLPLSLLLVIVTAVFRNVGHRKILLACIFIVSLLEPVYQATLMILPGDFPLWASAIIFFNLVLFNLTQLFIFKRYDFVSMYSFRIFYYLLWHIGWGHVRLID
jgi:hypothetical protein